MSRKWVYLGGGALALCILLFACVLAIAMSSPSTRPAENAAEVAVRQTADAIVRENAQAVATMTADAQPTKVPKPTNTARPTATATPRASYAIGDTIAVGNWEYKVSKVQRVKSLVWTEYGNKLDAKGTFLVVYMTLKNIGNKNFGINSWDFTLHDGSGVEYDTSNELEIYPFVRLNKMTTLGNQFPPGIPLDTALVFDINPAAKDLNLYLEQAKTQIDLAQ